MANLYTIDASVYLNAFNPSEAGHEISRDLLKCIQTEGYPMIVPTLMLPEVAAAVARGRNDAQLSIDFASKLARLPNLLLIQLDEILSKQAVSIAANHRLRGSDSMYGAVAQRFGSTLITLDEEQYSRLQNVIKTRYPLEAAKDLGMIG